jgi:hypothetical protein
VLGWNCANILELLVLSWDLALWATALPWTAADVTVPMAWWAYAGVSLAWGMAVKRPNAYQSIDKKGSE